MIQIWENKSKLVQLEKNGSEEVKAAIFKIKSSGLYFEDAITFTDMSRTNTFLKKSRLRLTEKVLKIENN